ncbi:hypothetical protein [Jiella marina]|uniref:hypothetical protein n=1 Tax=Jiella sp. LLJ827 TaxID=2917712 RepID=UPI002100E9EA|nr:hypothetical protein [Jiella sp. LLJ827]MCQ0987460.1 hypothetical protein [Jiella sp. LLJ827]
MSAALAFQESAAVGATILPFRRGGQTVGCPTVAQRTPQLQEEERDRLNRLRWLALKSRLAPRPNVERACLLLSTQSDAAIENLANTFFRGLREHANRELSIYRPGTANPSEDEIWLLRLMAAWQSGERTSGAALVAWRVRPEGRRWLRFLSESLAHKL